MYRNRVLYFCAVIIITFSAVLMFFPSYAAVSDTIADLELGQPGDINAFTASSKNAGTINTVGNVGFNNPEAVAIDQAGAVYVVDTGNNRVLGWSNAASLTNGAGADKVFGQQGSFTTNTGNNGGISADSLSSPYGVAVDSTGNLYVADFGNNRVLVYFTPYTTTTAGSGDTTADIVFGQGGIFTTSNANKGGRSADTLSSPSGVALDSGNNLYVADFGNNRVLEYQTPLTTDTTADIVFGQGGSFTSSIPNKGGKSADSLSSPFGVALDSGNNLYIADFGNNRVLEYQTPLTTDTTADIVFGQGGSFTTSTANNGGKSASSLSGPSGVAVDSENNLYVADSANNRVLVYYTPLTTDTIADNSNPFGQGSFGSSTCSSSVTASTLCIHTDHASIAVDGARNLWVADSGNHRVLRYDAPIPSVTTTTTTTSTTTTTDTTTTTTSTTTTTTTTSTTTTTDTTTTTTSTTTTTTTISTTTTTDTTTTTTSTTTTTVGTTTTTTDTTTTTTSTTTTTTTMSTTTTTDTTTTTTSTTTTTTTVGTTTTTVATTTTTVATTTTTVGTTTTTVGTTTTTVATTTTTVATTTTTVGTTTTTVGTTTTTVATTTTTVATTTTTVGTTTTTTSTTTTTPTTTTTTTTVNYVPDLILTQMEPVVASVNAGGMLIVNETVKNQGTKVATSFGISYHLSLDAVYGGTDDIILKPNSKLSFRLPGSGGTNSSTTSHTIPKNIKAGTYHVCASISSSSGEIDRSNNTLCSIGTVTVSPPDLVISELSTTTTLAKIGSTIHVSLSITNQGGSQPDASSKVELHSSINAIYGDGDDVASSNRPSISKLTPGQTKTFANQSMKMPDTPGVYYICAKADVDSVVTESDETNNTLCTATTITVQP